MHRYVFGTVKPTEKQTKRAAISSRKSPASTHGLVLDDFKPVNPESRPAKKRRTVSTPTVSSLTPEEDRAGKDKEPEENRAKKPEGRQMVSTMDGEPEENKAISEGRKKEKEEGKIAQLYHDEESSEQPDRYERHQRRYLVQSLARATQVKRGAWE